MLTGEAAMVTVAEVEKAQQAWGEGIVAISAAHGSGEDYVGRATTHVESLYAYGMSPVLFKPTMAAVQQFRPTFDEALSYFTASNGACPEDTGFAIQGWTKVRFDNQNMILNESSAIAMGNYFFTSPEGNEVKVEFTFGYMRDSNGALRINVHHSSLPASTN
ncbi:MAG: phosphoribosyl-AMP cyclohydrolase [Candidatus Poseidoniales archaeon]|nr:MAG: phosphoribosyl-AMP cyclohydrolase [Candidatus Poseidoniales archaeon]